MYYQSIQNSIVLLHSDIIVVLLIMFSLSGTISQGGVTSRPCKGIFVSSNKLIVPRNAGW